jgi:hypothetical protein
VIFAYNVGAGQVPSIVALSLLGQKIAFSENNTVTGTSNFHVLQFKTGAGNGTSATAPAVPGTGNTAVDNKIALAGGATTGPYVDYTHDVAYLTTNGNASLVHKITGVFNGTPTEATTGGWPATIPGNQGVSTPVYDNVSRHVFATDGSGFLDLRGRLRQSSRSALGHVLVCRRGDHGGARSDRLEPAKSLRLRGEHRRGERRRRASGYQSHRRQQGNGQHRCAQQ